MEKENVFFGIDDYMAMYSPYIKRVEARELAQCYVVGLMMDGDRMLAAEKIRPKIAVVVLGLSQGGYPQPTRSGPSAEHGFGMAVGNRRWVSDSGDFFKSILFVTF